jgi:hypothetical protein
MPTATRALLTVTATAAASVTVTVLNTQLSSGTAVQISE